MSKCIQCGAALPPVGECTACAAGASGPAVPAVRPAAPASLLDRELHLDRRQARGLPLHAAPAGGPPPPAPRTAAPPAPAAAPPALRAPSPSASTPPPGNLKPLSEPLGMARAAAEAPPAGAAAPAGMLPRATRQVPSGAARPEAAAPAPRAALPPQVAPVAAALAPNAVAANVVASSAVASNAVASNAVASNAVASNAVAAAPFSLDAAAQPSAAPGAALPRAESPRTATPRPERARPVAAPVGALQARPAPLWRRALAGAVDGGVVLGAASLYLLAAGAVIGVKLPQTAGGLDALVERAHALEPALLPGFLLLLVLAVVYAAWGALSGGGTLGRRLAGIRLVDAAGQAPGTGRAVVRALLSALSFLLFFGGFWLALFDRKGQTLHDKLTSTFVIHPS